MLKIFVGLIFLVFLRPVFSESNAGKIFLLDYPTTSISGFKTFVKKTAFLKKYGEVQINVATISERRKWDIIDPSDPYMYFVHWAPSLFQFYPPKELKGVYPKRFVKQTVG